MRQLFPLLITLFFSFSTLTIEASEEGEEIPLPSMLETKQDSDSLGISTQSYEAALFKTISILVGLIALVFFTIWMLRRLSHGRVTPFNQLNSIKILEKRPLSPKSILYLVEVEGKKVLLAESQCSLRKITTMRRHPPDAEETHEDL